MFDWCFVKVFESLLWIYDIVGGWCEGILY